MTAILLLGVCVPVGVASPRQHTNTEPASPAPTLVRQKAPDILSARARTFLEHRDSSLASVWVFFTDKGIKDAAEFERAANAFSLTERARLRRQRTGTERVLLADLPVHRAYVDLIIGLGATHRRSSRWLNAASFDIPFSVLRPVSDLSCVAEIRPVARFGSPAKEMAGARLQSGGVALEGEALDYGLSRTQMLQINAITAHTQGFTGRGVTIAITDTGFRKTHDAFAGHYGDGRVLAEYDFVMDDTNTDQEEGDAFGQSTHGTMTWSVAGGFAPGHLIGPAYEANFILCKTEDLGSETPVEEDNWVAALEFADSVGADVISTSLTYSDWYDFEDFDGQTAVITLAANRCDSLGIVMATAMGNGGPAPATIQAPADAFGILSVAAVNAAGTITSFSSRGPTFDRRLKPDVCAMGLDVRTASAGNDQSYRYGSGTSFATPLVAGAAAVLIEARPELTSALIREALRTTAGRADQTDYTYGYGIINLGRALTWPVAFETSPTAGEAPLEITFVDQSALTAKSLAWEFGDGGVSNDPAPTHLYQSPGLYDVTLTIDTDLGQFSRTVAGLISVHADTLRVAHVLGVSGTSNRVDVDLRNYLPLREIEIPFSWAGGLDLNLDSFSTAGLRTEYFTTQSRTSYDELGKQATILLRSTATEAEPALEPGTGPVLSFFFDLPYQPGTGVNPVELIAYSDHQPVLTSGTYGYQPTTESGSLRLGCCFGKVGDIDGYGGDEPTLADLSLLIDHLFINKPALACYPEADVNQSGGAGARAHDISIADVAVLIDHMFISGSSLILPGCL